MEEVDEIGLMRNVGETEEYIESRARNDDDISHQQPISGFPSTAGRTFEKRNSVHNCDSADDSYTHTIVSG